MMRNHHRRCGPKYLQNARSLHSLSSFVKITIRMECNVKIYKIQFGVTHVTHMYFIHRPSITQNTRRNYADENPGVIIASVIISYRVNIHTSTAFKLYLLHVDREIYWRYRHANNDRRGIIRGPILSYYTGIWCSRGLLQVHAVECKCVSNVIKEDRYVQS